MHNKSIVTGNTTLFKGKATLVVLVCTMLFSVFFTLKAIQMHDSFETSAYDLGVFQQALWLISQFGDQFNTVRGMHSHGDHFRPIDYLFIPLYFLKPSIHWAFLAQSLSVGLGALVLFRIAQRQLPAMRWVAPAFALIYLLNPVVHNPLVWQYHPLVLASGLYLLWLWFYLEQRSWPYYLVFILLLIIREDMCITTAAFGMVAILQRRFRYGIPVVIISVLWWLLVTRVVLPELNGEGYFRLEGGTLQVLYRHLFDTDFYIRQLWNEYAFSYWAWLLLPLLGLSLLAPLYLLPALPTLLVNPLVGDYSAQIQYHYSVNAMPFIFIAALFGTRKILSRFPRTQLPLVLALLVASSVAAYHGSRVTYSGVVNGIERWHNKAETRETLKTLAISIGPESGVAATDFYLPHIVNRRQIYLFPNPWRTWYWGLAGESQHHPNNVDYLVLRPAHAAQHQDLLTYLVNAGVFRYTLKTPELHTLQRVRDERLPREAALADWETYSKTHRLLVTRAELGDAVEKDGLQAGCKFQSGQPLTLDDTKTVDVDFTSVFPDIHIGAAYLYATIESAATQLVEISLGVDDGVSIWQGKQEIANIPGPQAFSPNQHRIPVQLHEGENRFCFRVDNVGGAWRIQASFSPVLQD